MTEGVRLFEGELRTLDEILQESSFDLFQGELHVAVSERLAEYDSSLTGDSARVLHNLLFRKSKEARRLTALCVFVGTYRERIKAVELSERSASVVRSVIGATVQIEIVSVRPRPLLERTHVGLYLAKAMLHWIFRQIGRREAAASVVVRAWVEVTLTLYPKRAKESVLLVYPFALKVWRQVHFFRTLRSQNYRFRCAGIPYPVFSVLIRILTGQESARVLAVAECEANLRHASELLRLGPSEILTSDEFEVAAFVLHGRLLASGVRVTNTAHGVGHYSPWVAYTDFIVFTETQKAFYLARNKQISLKVVPQLGRPVPLPNFELSVQAPLGLVLVHQPFESTPLHAEALAQYELDCRLADLAQSQGMDYALVRHPNMAVPRREWKERTFRGRLLASWSELTAARHIFFVINSTAFFDLRGAGVIVVHMGPTFSPSVYFPSPFLGAKLEDLPKLLEILNEPEAWLRASSLHANGTPLALDDPLRSFLC